MKKVKLKSNKVTIRVHKGKRNKEIVERNLRIHNISKIKEIRVKEAIIQQSQDNVQFIEVQFMQKNTNKNQCMIAKDTPTGIHNSLNSCLHLLHHILITLTTLMALNPLQFPFRITCTHQCILPWFLNKATNIHKRWTFKEKDEKEVKNRRKSRRNDP